MTEEQRLQWEKESLAKYELVISKIPLFHREIARQVVEKKAQINADERKAKLVEECDIVSAFFTEVPKAFYSLMIRLMDEAGLNYKKYAKK